MNRYTRPMQLSLIVTAVLVTMISQLKGEEPTRIEVSRDAWVSAYPTEVEGNNGGSHKLKLKGIQEFTLIDFDPEPLRGKRVQRAELVVRVEGEATLDRVTVSTVMAPWEEGVGNNYDQDTHGASFLWGSGKRGRWAGDGSDLTSISLGNGGSKWCFGDSSPPDADRRQRIPIDPDIVQSRIDGECHGFLLVDDLGSEYTRNGKEFQYHLMPNRFLASRDKNRSQAPYFQLWLSDQETEPTTHSQPTKRNAAPKGNEASKRIKVALKNVQSRRGESKPLSQALSPRLQNLDFQPLTNSDLSLARLETISFVVNAQPDHVQVAAPNGMEVSIAALPAIGGHHDPAVPLDWWSDSDWTLARGKDVKTCVDVHATSTASAGKHGVEVMIDGQKQTLEIQVWDFELPSRLRFIPQMNCYGLPKNEMAYFQLCHDHRTTLNRLRYGWSGKVNSEAVPTRRSDGSWDWTDWDQRYGPMLDGSAFANSKRGPVPIEAFYLPLNENWPMDHEKHFQGGYWIENAYDDAYWNEFQEASRKFALHLADQGYHETMFEFYLNNKVYFKQQRDGRWDACSAAWVFDEPVNTQDFWALRRFGIEFWKGVADVKGPTLAMRVDISRPQWQRNLLDGVSSVEIVSGSLRKYGKRVTQRARQFDNLVYMYGSANKFSSPNSTNAAWCVETWARGGNGVVPWQTIGTEASWKTPDALSVIYPSSFGPVPSLRLKSFRTGQQLVEYLELFRDSLGDVRADQIGDRILSPLGLAGQTIQSSEADAGSVLYDSDAGNRLRTFRYQLGSWLDGQSVPTPSENKPFLIPRQGLSDDTPDIQPVVLHDSP